MDTKMPKINKANVSPKGTILKQKNNIETSIITLLKIETS